MELSAPLMLVLIGLASLLAQWLAWLLRLPAILPLLLFGIVLGPTVHLVQPDLLFGDLLFPLVSLSVAIILFEGALTLRFEEIRGLGGVVRNLVTVGMLVTFLVISLASWWLLDFPPELAALIGAVTVVTGPTVIAPLMRVVRPNANINQVLRWEGIVIDPVGAIFTLLVFEFIVLKQNAESYTHLFWTLGMTAAVGLIAGALFGYLLGLALLFALLMTQGSLPLNPQGFPGLSWDLALNTAVSFVTNTNWQAYSGESALSYLSQMAGLAVQNFVSAATGIAVAFALIRAFTRRAGKTVGNAWADLFRITLYVLLPIALLIALFFVSQGTLQNFLPYLHVTTLEGAQQTLPMGPVASQEAIKMLGTNGGGFFGAKIGRAHV